MTSGTPTLSDASLTEPWKERSEKAVLRAKSERLRGRVAETYALAKSAKGPSAKNMCRRALIDAEAMIDLADEALRQDWLDR